MKTWVTVTGKDNFIGEISILKALINLGTKLGFRSWWFRFMVTLMSLMLMGLQYPATVAMSGAINHHFYLGVCSPTANAVFPINSQENFAGLVQVTKKYIQRIIRLCSCLDPIPFSFWWRILQGFLHPISCKFN